MLIVQVEHPVPVVEELLRDAPRRVFIRMSLARARVQDVELSRLAESSDRAERHQAYSILETEAAAAPTNGQIPACWGRPNAGYCLLHADVDSQASSYASEGLYIAATYKCRRATSVEKNSVAGTRASLL